MRCRNHAAAWGKDIPGFTPQIGRLVVMMSHARLTAVAAVQGLWFHVFEDEINHRGQIRWLRKRLPG